MKRDAVEVSVICLSYNHAKYIEDTLNSIIAQKTNFTFEIIIHDDCSVDGTTEIIKTYEEKYPNLIKPIYEKKNQYSQGRNVFIDISLPIAKGKYIAFCECDDYWMDDSKLQRQYDVMETHPEIDMCACGTSEVWADKNIEIIESRPRQEDCILSTEEVIEKVLLEGGCFSTASLFCRKILFDSLMEFEKILFFDHTLQIKGALRGGIYYIDRKMAVYRRWVKDSWISRYKKNREMQAVHLQKKKDMLQEFDRETKGAFHTIIEKQMSMPGSFLEILIMNKEEIKAEISNLMKKNDTSYLWGLGMRGYAFQEFCKLEEINLSGVCDIQNINVGGTTEYGYPIVDVDYVRHNSDIVFASNNIIHNFLVEKGYTGYLINLQKYM